MDSDQKVVTKEFSLSQGELARIVAESDAHAADHARVLDEMKTRLARDVKDMKVFTPCRGTSLTLNTSNLQPKSPRP